MKALKEMDEKQKFLTSLATDQTVDEGAAVTLQKCLDAAAK